IMDDSDTRRGLPSTHRRFEQLHRAHRWQGAPERFGVGAAILAGDLCLSWADTALLQSGCDPVALMRAKPAFDQMRAELMAGQYLDLVEQSRGGGSVERARTVVSYKSARYTIARPLEVGGRLAGADDELLRTYRDYGLCLGEAFQLRDDVLGVFGEADQTGKPVGDDLREGKQTLLIAATMERASDADAELLRDSLGDAGLDTNRVAHLQEIIRDCGALEHIEQLINDGRDAAIAHASGVPGSAGSSLRALAVAATSRHA
ncbi:MAG: polyprenyl synthetase family protein, partial [Actinobacteria bacterium]|nr:polyprenyl synthetase family protein [Actinomycetota bacterium]